MGPGHCDVRDLLSNNSHAPKVGVFFTFSYFLCISSVLWLQEIYGSRKNGRERRIPGTQPPFNFFTQRVGLILPSKPGSSISTSSITYLPYCSSPSCEHLRLWSLYLYYKIKRFRPKYSDVRVSLTKITVTPEVLGCFTTSSLPLFSSVFS